MWKQLPGSPLSYQVTDTDPLFTVQIRGPAGTVQAVELVRVLDRRDYIEDLYNDIVMTLQGHYHCCLTDHTVWL